MRARAAPLQATPVPDDLLERAGTLSQAILELVDAAPEAECLVLVDRDRRERRVSRAGFHARARVVQAALVERGLRPGESVVIALPTGEELVAAYFGAMFAGGVPALAATPSHRVADASVYLAMLGNVLQSAEARVLYADPEVAALARDAVPAGTAVVRPADVPDAASPPPVATRAPGDLATLQYSSGTTGAQKGVMLSHRAMLRYARALRDGLALSASDVHVNWAPLYHDMGLFGAFLLPLLCGCPTVLIPTMDFLRDPVLWLQAIDAYRGAVSWAPNFAYALCAKRIPDADLAGLDLSSWRVAANASEPVLASTVAAFAARFEPYGYRPEAMTPAWGLAETVMVGAVQPVDRAPRVDVVDRGLLAREGRAEPTRGEGLASVATGRCLPGFSLEVRDADGRPLPDRHVGALWLRAEEVFEGYKGDPEATARVRVDGWVDSGDRGYTVDGDVFFVARAKDLIIVGGDNHAPHDVEAAINTVPGVREGCAVAFGVTNEERGTEDVAAVVETRVEDEAERTDLRREIRHAVTSRLGLGVRHLLLVPPGGVVKTTSGKLARRATRERWERELADA